MDQHTTPTDDFIGIYDNVLTAKTCRRLIQQFEKDKRRHRGRTGHGVDTDKKDSWDLTISDHEDWADMVNKITVAMFKPLCQYMEQYSFLVTGALSPTVIDPEHNQPVVLDHVAYQRIGQPLVPQLVNHMYRCGRLNLQKYLARKGNYNHWHSEVFPQAGSTEPLHRVLLFQFYLNDVEKGGATNFYYQKRLVQPRQGRLIIAPAGFTHTHRGEVPESSDKYVITSWVLFKTAEDLYQGA